MAEKHMWADPTRRSSDHKCHTTPNFVENSHERPFSKIPKANTYGFLTKKWSPPEIQECDLWQRNICGVRCMSLWSMINGYTTPILQKITMNDHFLKYFMLTRTSFLTTNGLHNTY